MELTAENVEKVFMECFSEAEEGNDTVKCEAVVHSFCFSKEKLKENTDNIYSMLRELPEEFMQDGGGGYSFLAACNDKNGNQWTGLHLTMEKLFALGISIGKATCPIPRALWQIMPGGMPYFVVLR